MNKEIGSDFMLSDGPSARSIRILVTLFVYGIMIYATGITGWNLLWMFFITVTTSLLYTWLYRKVSKRK